jgi:hypothetical protein
MFIREKNKIMEECSLQLLFEEISVAKTKTKTLRGTF